MQRVTITVEDEFLEELDRMVRLKSYQNRSEAIRDMTRAALAKIAEEEDRDSECIAALIYTYDHETRELSKKLAHTFHNHHDLSLAALHVHLDHDNCLEVAVLRGDNRQVQHLADHVIASRGVRHGRLIKIPINMKYENHAHGAGRHPHLHTHIRNT